MSNLPPGVADRDTDYSSKSCNYCGGKRIEFLGKDIVWNDHRKQEMTTYEFFCLDCDMQWIEHE